MRLVNIHTRKLQEFMEGEIPAYAILSHRWTDEELTFKELSKDRVDGRKKGYRKLLSSCRIAAEYEVDYIWNDTCCIDKRSSAELSESINSMFNWYTNAEVCIAYLEDVSNGPDLDESFRESVWFKRSWTLQELLAPPQVHFYDGQWQHIGARNTKLKELRDITGVGYRVLDKAWPIWRCTVAERMAWAANRKATRSEDIAYSLMGIFDVNMPLLYGEGMKAFRRLQEEILRHTSDITILCWGLGSTTYRLLASSPADFEALRGLQAHPSLTMCQFGITNIGLEIFAEITRLDLTTFGILLGTPHGTKDTLALLVRKRPFEGSLHKVGIVNIGADLFWLKERRLLIYWGTESQELDERGFIIREVEHGLYIHTKDVLQLTPGDLKRGEEAQPASVGPGVITEQEYGFTWDFGRPTSPAVATALCQLSETETFSIDLSFDFEGRPCCLVYKSPPSDWRQVWRTSESFPQPVDTSEESQQETTMTPLQDLKTGVTFWFIRARSLHHFTWARIPAGITGEDVHAWMIFTPGDWSHLSNYWTFDVGLEAPLLHSSEPNEVQ